MSDEESIGDIDGGADEELDGVFEDADDEAAPVGDSDDEIEPGETPLPAATDRLEETHGRNIYVAPREEWITSDLLSEYEMTELVSIRASQIERDPSTAMCDIGDLDDCILIAQRELMERKCPLIVRRVVGIMIQGGETHVRVEDRDPREMQFSLTW
jgi:hypothetical protein